MGTKAHVILYTRPGCHLCEAAEAEIAGADCAEQFTLEIVNIEPDPTLVRRYGLEIPVVLINGVTAFKYRLTASEFKRAIHTASTGR